MTASDETRRADFEYLTGRPASVEEIAGSGTIRMHYESDGSIRQMACTAVDYHDPDIRDKVDARYSPENSPLVKVLVDIALSAARNDPDGSKLAASKASTAAADDAVKRHWPTGRYVREFDQRVSGGRHGALFGLHVATTAVKAQLGLSGDPSKSLLWLAPIAPGRRPTVLDILGNQKEATIHGRLRPADPDARSARPDHSTTRNTNDADEDREAAAGGLGRRTPVVHDGHPARQRRALRLLGGGGHATAASTNNAE